MPMDCYMLTYSSAYDNGVCTATPEMLLNETLNANDAPEHGIAYQLCPNCDTHGSVASGW